MDSLSSISTSIGVPSPGSSHLGLQRRHHLTLLVSVRSRNTIISPRLLVSRSRRKLPSPGAGVFCKFSSEDKSELDNDRDEIEKALHLDGTIPGNSSEFLKRVSSRAYDMRRNLHQSLDSSSYDVLDSNPWRESSKPVYVLTQKENQLCTMKTRTNRSEVENELGLLLGKRRPGIGNQAKQSSKGNKFQVHVEDIRDGVLVFEDENEAAKYCNLLQGGGKGCEGVAEIEASSVFDLCRKMRALAVLFRRGRTPPLPQSLELNLKARQRSLEDQNE
ncbi:hypothetical protein ACFE04_025062 [Oxalis oulophora]